MLKFGRTVYVIDLAAPVGATREDRGQRKEQRRVLKAMGVPLVHATRAAADKAIERVWAKTDFPHEYRVFEQTPVSF